MGGIKGIILTGGPSKGTRFRPLSLDSPKPLFPVAGKPLIFQHLKACARIPNLEEVLLLGFYDSDDGWNQIIAEAKKELGINIRYLAETMTLGTGGGLVHFQKDLLKGNPECIFLLHCDIVCGFPLLEMLSFHRKHGKEVTVLGKQVPSDQAHKYGCLAVDQMTSEALHYAEKPETFVSDIINGGIYIFSPSIYPLIEQTGVMKQNLKKSTQDSHYFRLENFLPKICGDKHVYVYQTSDFWMQVKSAGMLVKVSEELLNLMQQNEPSKLAKSGDGKTAPIIIGNVLIDPSAKVHPTAKLGPNVTVGVEVVIGPGVRISNSLVMDKTEVQDHACILNSIVAFQCVIGKWARLEGIPDYSADQKNYGMTILGTNVTVANELVIRRCIVLPHKELTANYDNQILL